MEDPRPLPQEGNQNGPPITDVDGGAMTQERAAAIAEVSTNAAIDPTSVAQRNALNREGPGGGGTGGGSRRNVAVEEAMQAGDMQNIDGPGSEVQNMFIEFLFGL